MRFIRESAPHASDTASLEILLMCIMGSVIPEKWTFGGQLRDIPRPLQLPPLAPSTDRAHSNIEGHINAWCILSICSSREVNNDDMSVHTAIQVMLRALKAVSGLCRMSLVRHGCHTALSFLQRRAGMDQQVHEQQIRQLHNMLGCDQGYVGKRVAENCNSDLCVRAFGVLYGTGGQ
eukprot:TRINITY_DN49_c0_g1_i1.p1 TRINITY_DN49_c0_g1~~TRINITY_DN49_c0_g1_i1.p1  ORF type:complete len:177 (-),score=28.59 TRINITY_DN49_c0_g1_i1:39-569(-)